MSNRQYFFLLTIVCILFLLLFFVLSYFNRLAVDDFYYLGGYAERGVWGCMRDLYNGYSGRWTAYLLTGWIVSLHQFNLYHFVFNCITILLWVMIIYSLIRKIIVKKLNLNFSKKLNLLFAVILICSLFCSTYNIGETWFWLVQVCSYLWSIMMTLVLLTILLEEKFRTVHIFLIIISSVFIGGASESFALINIFLLSFYLIFSYTSLKKYDWVFLPKNASINKKIFLALVFLLASFTITMLAPGNENRYEALPKVSAFQTIWIQVKSFIKITLIKTPLKLHYLLLFSFPWLILGNFFSVHSQKVNVYSLLPVIKKYFFVLLVLIFIFLIPTSFIMSELGPDRALAQISFLVTFCFAALFFIVGYKVEIREKLFRPLRILSIVFSIGILSYHLADQFYITKKYAEAYDQRMEMLKTLDRAGQKNTVELQPLLFSGMLYSAEISDDTTHFSNYFLEYSLHLKYHTKRKIITQ